MTCIVLNYLCVCLLLKQLVNVELVAELVFCSVQVDRGKVELGRHPLSVVFSFVVELHVEYRTRHSDHKLRHFEDLL